MYAFKCIIFLVQYDNSNNITNLPALYNRKLQYLYISYIFLIYFQFASQLALLHLPVKIHLPY